MRLLLALLLIGIVGCGDGPAPQTANADSVAALEKLGAYVIRNEQDDVVQIQLQRTGITDALMVHLKRLTNLQSLYFRGPKFTNAGLVHLKGLTKLEVLSLFRTKITDAGVADLKTALPNCKIEK